MANEEAAVVESVVVPMPRKRLTAFDILSNSDRKTKEIEVPEWGGFVTIITLSAKDALEFSKQAKEGNGPAALLVKAIVDEKGEPLFSENQLEALQQKSIAVITRLQDAVLELNGFGAAAAKLKEDAKKV